MNKTKPDVLEIHQQYGLWAEDRSCRLLEDAQAKLLKRLLEDFPSAPARILVAGVRIGLSVSSIARLGYTVIVVDPSAELIQHALKEHHVSEVDFRASDFMEDDLLAKESFNVLLFLETASRAESLDKMMSRARHLLKDNGSPIIADEMCYRRSLAQEMNLRTQADFTVSLAENGFFITRKENITKLVSDTPDCLINMIATRDGQPLSKKTNLELEERHLRGLDHWEKRKQGFESDRLGYEIISAKKSGFFLRSYMPGDENQILELFKHSFYTERSTNHWNWKYRENPYGSLKIALAVDEKGKLAAHYAGYPVPFCLAKDKTFPPGNFLAYQNGDTMTRQKYRNVGLGKTSLLARVFHYFIAKFSEDSLSFYYGFNTDKMKILGKRYMGYNYVDPVILRERDLNAKPLRNPGVFKIYFSGYSVEEVRKVNSEWDDFFDRVSLSYGLLVNRKSKYLRWRYLECPDKIHKIFAIRKRKRLVGWSVFSYKEKNLIWGDALFDENFHDSLDFLLYQVVKTAYPSTESIEAWFPPHPEWWNRRLDKSGFSKIPEPRGLTPCAQHNLYNDRKGPSLIEREKSCFYYTMGDSDLF